MGLLARAIEPLRMESECQDLETKGKKWYQSRKMMENDTETDGFRTVKSDLSVVKSGNYMANSGETLTVNMENAWKSRRKTGSERCISVEMALLNGGVVALALRMTYIEALPHIQLIAYLFAIALFTMTDPFHLVSRKLAKPSRYISGSVLLLMCFCIHNGTPEAYKMGAIGSVIALSLVGLLNNFWIKKENWEMSSEVESALNGDEYNKGGLSWQAHGRRRTRTALHEIGVSIRDEDLDSIFKASYLVGFWTCYAYQKDQREQINALQIENAVLKQGQADGKRLKELTEQAKELEEANEQLTEEYNELVLEFNDLVDQLTEYEAQEEAEPIESALDLDEQEFEIPSWITPEAFAEVKKLLEADEPIRSIEKITGVTRYRIKQIKEMIDESGEQEETKIVSFVAMG